MEQLTPSSALPKSRIPLSLPSSRFPSMKVNISNYWKSIFKHPSSVIITSYLFTEYFSSFNSYTNPSCSISPWSLLGAVHWLRGSLSGLRLHRLWPVPHGAVLDPEQRAHPVWGDRGEAAWHPVLHRSQSRQDGPHRSRRDLLQAHESVNRDAPVSPYNKTETGWLGVTQHCMQCVVSQPADSL